MFTKKELELIMQLLSLAQVRGEENLRMVLHLMEKVKAELSREDRTPENSPT